MNDDLDEFGLLEKPRIRRVARHGLVYNKIKTLVFPSKQNAKTLLELMQKVINMNKKSQETFPEVQRYRNFLDDYY